MNRREERKEERKIEKIKEQLKDITYPPFFNLKRWKRVKANCYAYALNIPVSDREKEVWIPGCICGTNSEKVIWSTFELIENLKKDLDFLEIKYREDDQKPLNYGEYRIAIYFEPSFHDCPIGFHISRQDIDGIWSEKPSWKSKVHRIGGKKDTPPDLSKYNLYLENVLILSK